MWWHGGLVTTGVASIRHALLVVLLPYVLLPYVEDPYPSLLDDGAFVPYEDDEPYVDVSYAGAP